MKTLNLCFVALVAGLAAANSLRAAVQDAAFLQGSTLADGSVYLNSATPKAIAWTEKSSVDPGIFEHSLVEPAKLMVKQDGDYLVAATMPIISIDDNDNRPCQALEVYVNGEPAPGTVGSSGYIRNQPRNANMQRETSDHAHALLAGLSAGDVIEVRAYKTAQPAIRTQIQSASLYVERVDASRTVFAALSDDDTNNANLNPDFDDPGPTQLAWTFTRKDSGITHNNGQPGIRLSAGTYMLFVNIPMQSTVQRASAGLEILLGDEVFPAAGFTAFQGYIRSTSGHNEASVHWAGVIQVEGTETLILQTVRQAQAGNVTIQPDKQASVYLEKIDDASGLLAVSAIGVNNGANNWNPASKVAVKWDTESINDSSLFQRSGPNNTGIQIQQAGHYLLLYQDTLFTAPGGGPDRPNPRISIEVNGQEVAGAETKTHYIRDANDHNESSASLVFLLENLAANDTITVSAQREGQTGIVSSTDSSDNQYGGGALLSLIQKESLADPGSIQSAPRLVEVGGNVNGFQARIQNFSASVDEGSVQATLNGEAVTPDVQTSGGFTTISYNFPEVPLPMSVHQVSLSFSDTNQSLHQNEFQFTVEIFARIPPEFAASGVDTDAPGFIARVSQISTTQSGAAQVHGNTIAGAERQLAGELINAEGNPYTNEAGPANASTWEITPVEVETVINFEEGSDGTPGPTGRFTVNNGAEDEFIPQIPASVENKDGIVAEFLTFLELSQGFHTFGVNSDDGFEVKSGPSLKDLSVIALGEWNSWRGVGETRFDVYVEENGIYPVRLLWWEGGGGASVEFYSILENGDRILINDRDNPNAIKAYRSAAERPYISSVSPTGTVATDSIEYTINDDEVSVVGDSVGLTLNGAALDPEVTKSGDVTTVRYVNPDGYFPGGTHVAVLTYDESSNPVVTRTFRHEFNTPEGQTVVVRDGPFAYWRLGETEVGATQANNEISEFHTGTYQNSPGLGAGRLVVGDPSSAVLFEAEKQHWISIPNHADINNLGGNPGWPEKTIEFWFKARNLPNSDLAHPDFAISQRQVIYEQGGATRGMNVYLEGIEDGQNPTKAMLWFNVLNRAEVSWGGTAPYNEDVGVGIDQNAVAISTEIEKDTIYHVALVFEEDTGEGNFDGGITGYLNGEKFGEATGANQLRNHTDGIGIGRRNNEVSFHDLIVNASTATIFNSPDHLFYYDGWLDEFALYNDALTADQVKAHYEAGLMEVPLDPVAPPMDVRINSIELVASGDDYVVRIDYSGTLKSAATVNGPFVEVEGATSPFTVTPDQEKMFYIVE